MIYLAPTSVYLHEKAVAICHPLLLALPPRRTTGRGGLNEWVEGMWCEGEGEGEGESNGGCLE